ncbi:MAG: roadblock/LC7 domain-containing protein [Elainellaceae cyanobacterium]
MSLIRLVVTGSSNEGGSAFIRTASELSLNSTSNPVNPSSFQRTGISEWGRVCLGSGRDLYLYSASGHLTTDRISMAAIVQRAHACLVLVPAYQPVEFAQACQTLTHFEQTTHIPVIVGITHLDHPESWDVEEIAIRLGCANRRTCHRVIAIEPQSATSVRKSLNAVLEALLLPVPRTSNGGDRPGLASMAASVPQASPISHPGDYEFEGEIDLAPINSPIGNDAERAAVLTRQIQLPIFAAEPNSTRPKSAELTLILQTFVSTNPMIQGAAIVTSQGSLLAASLPDGFDEAHVLAISETMLSFSRYVGETLGNKTNQIYVEGEKGSSLFISCGDGVSLLVLANKTVKQGFLMSEIRRFMPAIEPYLAQPHMTHH